MTPSVRNAGHATVAVGLAGLMAMGSIASSQAVTEQPVTQSPRGDVPAKLRWRSCPAAGAPTMQCARLLVPLSYTRWTGRWFNLAIVRIPATGAKLGSLFFNPGGPGGSGTQALAPVANIMSASVKARFDIVTWDPRGVGRTIPALKNCAQPSVEMPTGLQVDWANVQRRAVQKLGAANRICQRSNSSYINAIGTNNVARDLDRLRDAVGDSTLNFWGASYGTHIGYVYATMFPGRIRALVLDGNMTPTEGFAGVAGQGGLAPDSALQFMRTHYPSGYNALTNMAESLTTDPIPLGGGVMLTRWSWLNLLIGAVASQRFWPQFPALVERVEIARDPTPEGVLERKRLRAAVTAPDSNAGGVFSAVECIDYPQRMTNPQQVNLVKRNAVKGPWFGGMLTVDYARGCSGLQLKPDPIPNLRSAVNRAKVAKVKVVISNATHDGETPYVWAEQMVRGFKSSAFVSYSSGQHVIWNFVPSNCVDSLIDRYVLTGLQPRSQLCPFVKPQQARNFAGSDDVLAEMRSADW